MSYIFFFIILIVGLSGLIAQVLLLRELLVNFYGNELTLGIILANWVIIEAAGAFLLGQYIDRIRNKINPVRNTEAVIGEDKISNGVNVFVILQLIFSVTLPLSIYLSRVFKGILGIPFGQGLGLFTMLYVSFFILLPSAISHGALFSCGCKIYRSIGKIYAFETIGTVIGGIILTYLLIPYLNSFQITFLIALSNLVICLFLLKYTPNIIRYITLSAIALMLYLFLSGNVRNIQRFSINRQWAMGEVLDYHNSVYGNIVVTQKEKQYTFFYNGIPIITTPYPDITFVQEFGHLPLLFHPAPKDILIISGGAGGLINEVLKHPIRKVDYVELDPLIIEMVKSYPFPLTARELADNRVNIINLDGRFFIRTTHNKYDVVLIGLSRPSDLSTNRLFTQEFFSLVKERLSPQGILAFCLPGSLTYLSSYLRDLNACILNGLKNICSYVRIIPGDYNMFLDSESKDILKVNPNLITQRINQQNIKTDILISSYLDYRLNDRWLTWFMRSSLGATRKVNQDLMPFAVFQMLIFWNRQFSPLITHIFESFQNLDLRGLSVLIFIITLVFFYIFYRWRKLAKLSIAYSIATTGFFGMLINLVLIFSFQAFYGYLYRIIGILISIFMAGIALGSIFMTQRIFESIKNGLRLFIKLEVLIVLFSYVLGLIITRLSGHMYYSSLIFIALFFISGLLMGLEFPLASRIYLNPVKNTKALREINKISGGVKDNDKIGTTVGVLYGADLFGGWVAGMLGGIVFLPILGLFSTCMVIVILKLSSLLLLLISRDTLQSEYKGIPQ